MTSSSARRDRLVRALRSDSSLHVAGVAVSFPHLRSLISEAAADVIVLDLQSRVEPGVGREWVEDFLSLAPVVVLSPEPNAEIFSRIVRAGAGAMLPTQAPDDQIVQAIRSVAAGLMVFGSNFIPQRQEETESLEALTPRESEVLQLLSEGLGNKEIAFRLHISEHTIKFHIRSILGKLGASSRTEAVSRGLRSGLIEL